MAIKRRSARILDRTNFNHSKELVMSLHINDAAPDFEAETTEGPIRLHNWIGESWAVLFSHPKDFTPVCSTELGYLARIEPEFDKRNTKIIGLSVDALDDYGKWADDIRVRALQVAAEFAAIDTRSEILRITKQITHLRNDTALRRPGVSKFNQAAAKDSALNNTDVTRFRPL